MVGQRAAMETNCVRNPAAVLSGSPGEPTQMVTPVPRPHPHQSDSLLDGEKTGAALLFSGALLALVGITFTAMGWQQYQADFSFEWTKLLGPVLISVGGTFMLTSICKFGVVSCWPRRHWDEEGLVMPVTEQTSRGLSCSISGLNQPVVLHSAMTMRCIPPAYNFITQEVRQAIDFLPGCSVNGSHAALPPHEAVFCVDNTAFTTEEDGIAHSRETDGTRSRFEKTEDEGGRGDESGSTCSRPPAYEDIFPSFGKHCHKC